MVTPLSCHEGFRSRAQETFGLTEGTRCWDPVVIDSSDIDDFKGPDLCKANRGNLALVNEGKPASKLLPQVGDQENPLDHTRSHRRGTTHLIVVAPSDLESYQAHLLDEAKEFHHEEFFSRVLHSMPGTNVSILCCPASTRAPAFFCTNKANQTQPCRTLYRHRHSQSIKPALTSPTVCAGTGVWCCPRPKFSARA